MEGSPGHIMTKHLEVYEFQERGRLEILSPASAYVRPPKTCGLTHIRTLYFCPTFFQTVLNVLLLLALVIPQPPDEVVKGFFEPARSLLGAEHMKKSMPWVEAHMVMV